MGQKIEIKNRFNDEIIVSGTYANFKEAVEKNKANLHEANLRGADLYEANLCEANLYEANLDFSVLFFSCKSLKAKTDRRQRVQLGFHFLSWIASAEKIDDDEKEIYNFCLKYVNKFHRSDVPRLEVI